MFTGSRDKIIGKEGSRVYDARTDEAVKLRQMNSELKEYGDT